MTNAGTESVHLILFPYTGGNPEHFDVTATTTHTLAVPYRCTLLGPNGFRREFAGGPGCGEVSTSLSRTRVLLLTLANKGTAPLTFVVGEKRYEVRPGRTRTVSSTHPTGWYDLTVRVAEDPNFHRRLAGHIENGHESVSG
jgi:phospholipase C